jgi:hypothetical protein
VINVSNSSADCSWVRSHSSTHHKGDGNLTLGGLSATASAVIESLKGLTLHSNADLPKIDAALASVFGQAVSWTAGIQTSEVAAAQTPFSRPASSSSIAASAPAARKSAAKKTAAPMKSIATKPTRLDDAKAQFNNLTPKQKVELVLWAAEKIEASAPCRAEREKLAATA